MRIAALYDIHGNQPALEAVLAQVELLDVDQVVVGGDVVPGPMPLQCLELLASLRVPTQFIHGNGERAVLEQASTGKTTLVPPAVRDMVRWVGDHLPVEMLNRLATWPSTITVAHPSLGDILFCHGTPRSDTEIFTRNTPEAVLAPIFDAGGPHTVICGHTHMQFVRQIGRTRVVNAGSVGMPFGERGAYWLLITDDDCLRQRTGYDFDAAAERIRQTTYPGAGEFADKNVLAPPSEETMLAAFASAELR